MTPSWFDASKLPEDWRLLPLRRLGRVLNGGTPTPDPVNWDGPVPFVTPPDLNGADGALVATTGRTLTKVGTRGAGLAPGGSVLVSTRAPIGHVGRISEISAFNQGCRAVAPQAGVEPRYMALALVAARAELMARGQGTTFIELSSSAFASIPIPVPSPDEQRAIADYLDHETAQIDALMTKQKELIRCLDERRLAVITTTTLTGLRDEEAGGHDVTRWGSSLAVEPWLARAPRSWGTARFKSVCLPREERNVAGTELMLSLTVKGQLVDRSAMTIQQNASDASIPRYFVARPGDLVVNPMWLIGGAIGVSDRRGAVSPDYRVFEIAESLDPWYLHAVLRSAPYFDQYVLYTRSNTTFDRRIKQNDLANLPLPIPPIDEQLEIVEHINEQTTQIDALIAKAEEHIALARERRSALITAAVTGKIDVRTARRAS